MKTPLG
jgi:hypothetical protein